MDKKQAANKQQTNNEQTRNSQGLFSDYRIGLL
jgi:hypothetical protein